MVNTTCHCLSEETGGSSMVIVQGDVDTQVDLVGDWGKEIEFQVGVQSQTVNIVCMWSVLSGG